MPGRIIADVCCVIALFLMLLAPSLQRSVFAVKFAAAVLFGSSTLYFNCRNHFYIGYHVQCSTINIIRLHRPVYAWIRRALSAQMNLKLPGSVGFRDITQ